MSGRSGDWRAIAAALIALVLVALAAVHFYWALGGARGRLAAVPEREGRPAFHPGPVACASVGVLLLFATLLVWWSARMWTPGRIPLTLARLGTGIVAAAFLLRAIGDFKYVGFFKRVRGTGFARSDSRLYTPLCLLLGLGAAAVAIFSGASD